MVMNAFDTNFDEENEVYAVNSIPHAFIKKPIQIERDRPVRIYLINVFLAADPMTWACSTDLLACAMGAFLQPPQYLQNLVVLSCLVAVSGGAIKARNQAGSGSSNASYGSGQNNGRNCCQGELLDLRNFEHRK